MQKRFWSYIKALRKKNTSYIPVLVKDDISYETSLDKTEVLNSQYLLKNLALQNLTRAQVPIQPCLISLCLWKVLQSINKPKYSQGLWTRPNTWKGTQRGS